jgi:predicted MFS family arabinose efflux permease
MSNIPSDLELKDAWHPIFCIAVGTFATVTTEFLPVGLLPQISGSLGISLSRSAWLSTPPGLVAALAAPLLLVGVGRIDRRRLLLLLTGLTALSNFVAALSQDFVILLVARFLLGPETTYSDAPSTTAWATIRY